VTGVFTGPNEALNALVCLGNRPPGRGKGPLRSRPSGPSPPAGAAAKLRRGCLLRPGDRRADRPGRRIASALTQHLISEHRMACNACYQGQNELRSINGAGLVNGQVFVALAQLS
jgi:hypothetical protein